MSRATEFADHIQRELTRLRADTQAAAGVHYDTALAALAALRKLDERARDQFESDQRFVASDLVFMDSPAEVDRFTAAARAAFTAEVDASRARFDGLMWGRFGVLAVAVLAAGGLAWTFARVQAETAAPKPKPTTAEMLKNLPPAVKPATTPVAAVPAAPPGPSPSLVLSDTAELCVDLARVADGSDLPGLVERTARLLDAKGVVVWAVDTAGATLQPSVTHGYADKVVARLGTLAVDAENVTSLAFRSKRPQCMSSTVPGTPGALAVPLITAAGCVGVLAAEVKPNRPISDLVPVAKIIAAQFAALVTPAAASGHQGRQGHEDMKASRAAP
jgi:hypothetical protein